MRIGFVVRTEPVRRTGDLLGEYAPRDHVIPVSLEPSTVITSSRHI